MPNGVVVGYNTNMQGLMQFGYDLYIELKSVKSPVFLCVGSDKFVIDSLAPIVAEKLKNEYSIPAIVYGGLSYNVNRLNLMEVVCYIEAVHEGSPIVLIDATLGENVGDVEITRGVYAGLGNCLPNRKLGALSILGVVGRKIANFNLNSTRLKYIMDMADFIAKGCCLAMNKIAKDKCLKVT